MKSAALPLLALALSLACTPDKAASSAPTALGNLPDGSLLRDAAPPRRCNGHEELCDRRYDEVAFPGTHNSHSAREYGYTVNANQVSGLAKQLEDGIRVMLIDVYSDGDAGTVFCHGFCSLGETSHLAGLEQAKTFLDAHPDEVLTFIYEDHVPPDLIAADMQTAGLVPMTYVHEDGAPWPTLGEMIDRGTRLVVTAENASPPPAWLQHVWDLAFDTPYTFFAETEFTCALNRGAATNPLFLLNHWLSTNPGLNLPTEDGAKQVNTAAVLGARAAQCRTETGHLPNFVAVDFYEDGDLFAVVDGLNGF
ncbi:MAG TPA: hypothetical protein VHE30_07155 [Polyangiaceae bacterium]|nr:hypothetical protein [Polyangiaceae bacterium]